MYSLTKKSVTECVDGYDLEWCKIALEYCTGDSDYKRAHGFSSRQMEEVLFRIKKLCVNADKRMKEINRSAKEYEHDVSQLQVN